MKTNYLKRSLWLAAIVLTSLCAKAQTGATSKTAYDSKSHNEYTRIYNEDGHNHVRILTDYNDKMYRVDMVDDKLTSLFVDGEKIPEADWSKYDDVIGKIREEIKEQIKRNAEQAIRNKEQEKRNAEQVLRNQEQEKRNAEQAVRNDEQAKKNAEQAIHNKEQEKRNAEQVVRDQEQVKKNEEQAVRNQEQEKKNAELAVRNKEQDKLNAEQAVRNQEQAKRNAEQEIRNKQQAVRNQEQAKRNEEQARENAQFIKDITDDLASDKIIPDTNSLREMKLNEFGMSINGVRQSEEVFKKYKAKYAKFFEGNFNYSRDGFIREN